MTRPGFSTSGVIGKVDFEFKGSSDLRPTVPAGRATAWPECQYPSLMPDQVCSTQSCGNLAAFTTRSRPAWCTDCLDRILLKAGLTAAEPFKSFKAWWLTNCVGCTVQAHYRLEYILGNNAKDEKTCRACYWKSWSAQGREYMATHVPDRQLAEEANRQFDLPRGWSYEQIKATVNNNGYELIGMTSELTRDAGHSTMVVRCVNCRRISVERLGDIGWGCSCSRNQNRSSYSGRSAKPELMKDSDSDLLQWWDHERNTVSDFETVTLRATRVCHWTCPKCANRFTEKVSTMASGGFRCLRCRTEWENDWQAEKARWQRTPVADVPTLAAAWADEADARRVPVVGSGLEAYRFMCPNGHTPTIRPLLFLHSGCPYCRANESKKNRQYLADTDPEVASQWHTTLNKKLTPETVLWNSKRNVWWRADCCGHEWQEPVRDRNKYQRWRCPNCRTILDSLAWHDPGLAAEWSLANPVTAWQVRPTASTTFPPEWICSIYPEHIWTAPLASRSHGAECPECRQTGKSRIELDYHRAAADTFGHAHSGVPLRDKAFTSRSVWSADITVKSGDCMVVIEYDGSFWHSPAAKRLIDERKSRDLLAAGHLVVRLREDDLPPLGIEDRHYREIRVYSSAPQPQQVMEQIRDWVDLAISDTGA